MVSPNELFLLDQLIHSGTEVVYKNYFPLFNQELLPAHQEHNLPNIFDLQYLIHNNEFIGAFWGALATFILTLLLLLIQHYLKKKTEEKVMKEKITYLLNTNVIRIYNNFSLVDAIFESCDEIKQGQANIISNKLNRIEFNDSFYHDLPNKNLRLCYLNHKIMIDLANEDIENFNELILKTTNDFFVSNKINIETFPQYQRAIESIRILLKSVQALLSELLKRNISLQANIMLSRGVMRVLLYLNLENSFYLKIIEKNETKIKMNIQASINASEMIINEMRTTSAVSN